MLSGIVRFTAAAIGSVLAFLAALLPERIKKQEPFSGFQSNAAHILSGISESVLALVLFIYGYNHFVGGFSLETSSAITELPDSIPVSEAQMRGMGVLGFVLYLLHPVALVCLYLFIEGIVRACAAGMTERFHGIGVFWVIDRFALFARAKWRGVIRRRQLGPAEPDSIFRDEASGSLILTSIEDKDWHQHQVAQYGADFYVLSTKNLVRWDRYYRYRYTFRHMLPGEIIRGRVVVIPAASPQR